MQNKLNGAAVQDMVRHWLSTPPNGYLGSGYGSDPQSLLQQPLSSGMGDAFIDKMAADIPIIGNLPSGAVNAYFEDIGNDSKRLLIQVADGMVTVYSAGQTT